MEKEYCVTCKTFENYLIDGADFDSPLYGHDYYMNYKPTIKEIKKAYGKGWEFVTTIIITEFSENGEQVEEVIKNEDY